jgi:DNA-binding response OmpR family regulator
MEELLDAGVCGFIQKPFTLNELLDKLHEILK